MRRQVSGDLLPGPSHVSGLVEERITVIHQMEINADVSGACIETGRRDARNRAPWGKSTDVLGDIDPLTAIVGVPNLAVVGSGPYESFLHRRGRDRENDFSVELAEIVADDSP